MREKKGKVIIVWGCFVLAGVLSLAGPGLLLKWQDKSSGDRMASEIVEEPVDLESISSFPLEEKVKMLSGYNKNIQVASLRDYGGSTSNLEINRIALNEYEKLRDMNLLNGKGFDEVDQDNIAGSKYLVFDKERASHSFTGWSFWIWNDLGDEVHILFLEEESKKVIAFAKMSDYRNVYLKEDTVLNICPSGSEIKSYADYLGLEMEILKFQPEGSDDKTEWSGNIALNEEREFYGTIDLWGNAWTRYGQMELKTESENFPYRIVSNLGSYAFGEYVFFW